MPSAFTLRERALALQGALADPQTMFEVADLTQVLIKDVLDATEGADLGNCEICALQGHAACQHIASMNESDFHPALHQAAAYDNRVSCDHDDDVDTDDDALETEPSTVQTAWTTEMVEETNEFEAL